jgi:uncharacterized protein (TIGR03067 family)
MTRLMAMAVLVLGLCPALADDKDELAKFAGTWVGVSAVEDGKEMPKAQAEALRLTVEGEKYTFKTASTEAEGTHKLDPAKSPKQIEAVRTKGPHAGEKMLGIYELTDDTFKVCFAAPGKTDRPTEFKSAAGSGHRLMVLKKEKR